MKEEPIAENDSLRFKEGGREGGGTRFNTPAALSSREMTQMLSAKHAGFSHGESRNLFVQGGYTLSNHSKYVSKHVLRALET